MTWQGQTPSPQVSCQSRAGAGDNESRYYIFLKLILCSNLGEVFFQLLCLRSAWLCAENIEAFRKARVPGEGEVIPGEAVHGRCPALQTWLLLQLPETLDNVESEVDQDAVHVCLHVE